MTGNSIYEWLNSICFGWWAHELLPLDRLDPSLLYDGRGQWSQAPTGPVGWF